MMRPSQVIFMMFLSQAVASILLVCVLHALHRFYRRGYLREWTWAWWANAIALTGMAVAIVSLGDFPSDHPFRLATSCLALAAGYAQLCWVLAGAYDVWREKQLPARVRAWSLAACAALGVGIALASASPALTPGLRVFFRMGLQSLASFLCFSAAGIAVFSGFRGRRGWGRNMVAAAFLGYGLLSLNSFVTNLLFLAGRQVPQILNFAAVDAILVLYLTGLGVVVWLLEEERQRATTTTRELEQLAFYDALTGLPNREMLVERLWMALAQAKDRGTHAGLVCLDLDRFKTVNESLGHSSGDVLLYSVAQRLRGATQAQDTVARLSGDQFAVLLTDRETPEEIHAGARSVMGSFKAPFVVQGQELFVSCSAGVYTPSGGGSDPELCLKNSEMALEQARERGGGVLETFAPAMTRRAHARFSVERDLHRALEGGELTLHYQPVVSVATGEPAGVEALLRWDHPGRGRIMPEEFLHVAEASGLMGAIDLWVLRAACAQAGAWHQIRKNGLKMAVNLSARAFQHPDLVPRVQRALEETGLEGRFLELEITESVAMKNPEASLKVLKELRRLGVGIAIDDFGTGYSSLSYLQGLPVTTLKIDQSFVRQLGQSTKSTAIASAVMLLAHSLDVRVVAEGVETEAQRTALKRQRCELMQGFLFSPAIPPDECLALLRSKPWGGGADVGEPH
jgi:diguanylate cyclase (GGDEF)-like protein